MHGRAARMAREVIEQELPTAAGKTDHELTGQLERLLRRAGAEDVVILVSDGEGPPLPAEGRTVGPHTSVVVAIEYNGHWAKVTRNVSGVTAQPADTRRSDGAARDPVRTLLVGEPERPGHSGGRVAPTADPHREIETLYYGDTCLQGQEGLRVL